MKTNFKTTRENSGCQVLTQPTAKEKAQARKSFINRARALLKFLGYDPTPDNVSKVTQDEFDERSLTVNNRNFKVLDNEETLSELEFVILSEPKLLPAKFLAIFISKAFDITLDFNVIVVIAESLRRDKSLESNWALHELIKFDKFVKEHIQEIIDHTGLNGLFLNYKVGQTTFNGNNYVILETPIKSSIGSENDEPKEFGC